MLYLSALFLTCAVKLRMSALNKRIFYSILRYCSRKGWIKLCVIWVCWNRRRLVIFIPSHSVVAVIAVLSAIYFHSNSHRLFLSNRRFLP